MSTRQLPLVDDCAHCLGLCCVLLSFAKSADFAADKPAGVPCQNLDSTHRCQIHASLRDSGYRGCVAYTCFGAGPTLTRAAAGSTWEDDAATRSLLERAFPQARQLHELAWYLREAAGHPLPHAMQRRVSRASHATESLARSPLEELANLAVAEHWGLCVDLLNEVSVHLRGPLLGRDLRGADLMGTKLRGSDLSRANLRGARLVAADLRHADLTLADLTGADLRDARLDGADLSASLFVTSAQLSSARGASTTRLPSSVVRPSHWTASRPGRR